LYTGRELSKLLLVGCGVALEKAPTTSSKVEEEDAMNHSIAMADKIFTVIGFSL
jgi:hypothetical protein